MGTDPKRNTKHFVRCVNYTIQLLNPIINFWPNVINFNVKKYNTFFLRLNDT